MGSAADSPFDPCNVNVLLAADVVYDVGKIPSLVRATRKLFLLTDLPPPLARRCGSPHTVIVIIVIGDYHQKWR